MDSKVKQILVKKLLPNKHVEDVEFEKLPQMGVTSSMLKVKVTVKNQISNKEEVLRLVAKTIGASEIGTESTKDAVFFKKEVAFYEVILPVLRQFQEEESNVDGLDIFADFYGAIYSETGEEDSIILLEDLSEKGFSNIDRKAGFDLNFAKKILHDLARFHGTALALKIKRPNMFVTKIKPHCEHFNVSKSNPFSKNVPKALKEIIQSFPEYGHLVEKATNFEQTEIPDAREPFSTLVHFDLWVNNIMNKIEKDGTVNNKFVDFQIYDNRSPAADVFFFLWTSVEYEVLKQNLDHLQLHYHKIMLNTLKDFQIDTTLFDYEHFKKEMQYEASEYEFRHALLFKTFVMYLNTEELQVDLNNISPEFKDFLHFMVTECAKRGWLT